MVQTLVGWFHGPFYANLYGIIVPVPTLYRIPGEEQALFETFGEEYRAYMHRAWRLFTGW